MMIEGISPEEDPVEIVHSRDNPRVSVDAYRSSDRSSQHERVERYMMSLGARGAIADEVDAHFGNDPPIMWRRFAEMRHKGVIKLHPEGLERDTRLGHPARVHVWVPPSERVVPTIKRVSHKLLVEAATSVVAARKAKDPIALRESIKMLAAVLG